MAARVGTHYAYRTPHGLVTIATSDRGVTRVVFGDAPLPGERRPSELANRTATELLEYFAGKRRAFDVPLAPAGTPGSSWPCGASWNTSLTGRRSPPPTSPPFWTSRRRTARWATPMHKTRWRCSCPITAS